MPWVWGSVSVWYNADMSIHPKATCEQCRYYEKKHDAPSGDCHGLPPHVVGGERMTARFIGEVTPSVWADATTQYRPVVADLAPACSLFEMRAVVDCPTEAPTIGSDEAEGPADESKGG